MLTSNSGVLSNDREITVSVDESMTKSGSIGSDSSRLGFIHVELERTSIYR